MQRELVLLLNIVQLYFINNYLYKAHKWSSTGINKVVQPQFWSWGTDTGKAGGTSLRACLQDWPFAPSRWDSRGCSVYARWVAMLEGVHAKAVRESTLPVLFQAGPAQQHRPQKFPQLWEMRMWWQPAAAQGKAYWRPPNCGRDGKNWAEKQAIIGILAVLKWHPHESKHISNPVSIWKHWGCHWDSHWDNRITMVPNVIGASFLLTTMSWDVRFFWTSTLWRQKADITQTLHASLHPKSLSDVPDLAVSVLHFSFCVLVHATQFSATSSPVLFKPGSICTAVTGLLILFPYILILSTDCHKLLPVLSSFIFSLQNQVMLQQKSIPPQSEDQLLVIKAVTVVARHLPRPRFSSLSLISKTFKHMFTCRLMIISLRLARAMPFCVWIMQPQRLMNYF